MTEDGIATRTRALAGALAEGGFARLRVRDGEIEIEVRRGARRPPGAAADPASPSALASSAEPRSEVRPPDVIASDVVGIVRLQRPVPVEGQSIDGDRDLGYVETLGIRNPVRSRGSGRVSAVFVVDGQPVEYGQPLFAIER